MGVRRKPVPDSTEWPIEVGALVRYDGAPKAARKPRGWVLEKLTDKQGRNVVRVRNEHHGGICVWEADKVVVIRPTDLQKARGKGIDNAMTDASARLKRRRIKS